MPTRAQQRRAKLLAHALAFPGAYEDFPWGESVAKVNKKVFVFLGMEDDPQGMGVKLAESHEQAMSMSNVEPSGYGLGKAGWVSVTFAADGPPICVLRDWIEESYRLVAPKKLIAQLDG